MARTRTGKSHIIDTRGRRRLTRNEKIGIGSLATLLAVGVAGVIAGVILDRLLDFNDALDAGGEWDEGGGVFTRWE
ncbi:hypothetical protein GVN24_23685 [Rhizobium sp. CRIBSB]|nr:hypothetical protein [Rhizobium sp. CRIBSB]